MIDGERQQPQQWKSALPFQERPLVKRKRLHAPIPLSAGHADKTVDEMINRTAQNIASHPWLPSTRCRNASISSLVSYNPTWQRLLIANESNRTDHLVRERVISLDILTQRHEKHYNQVITHDVRCGHKSVRIYIDRRCTAAVRPVYHHPTPPCGYETINSSTASHNRTAKCGCDSPV